MNAAWSCWRMIFPKRRPPIALVLEALRSHLLQQSWASSERGPNFQIRVLGGLPIGLLGHHIGDKVLHLEIPIFREFDLGGRVSNSDCEKMGLFDWGRQIWYIPKKAVSSKDVLIAYFAHFGPAGSVKDQMNPLLPNQVFDFVLIPTSRDVDLLRTHYAFRRRARHAVNQDIHGRQAGLHNWAITWKKSSVLLEPFSYWSLLAWRECLKEGNKGLLRCLERRAEEERGCFIAT